ncbi:MAG: hypothetical protein ACKOZX_03245, partial [Gammaproteobacteria bacterium]
PRPPSRVPSVGRLPGDGQSPFLGASAPVLRIRNAVPPDLAAHRHAIDRADTPIGLGGGGREPYPAGTAETQVGGRCVPALVKRVAL